jgi:hypothetical protein
MTKESIKTYCSAVIQLLIALTRLLIGGVQLSITWCDNRLAKRYIYFTKRSLACGAEGKGGRAEPVSSPGHGVQCSSREIAKQFIDLLSDHDEDFIESFRQKVEDNALGRRVVARHPDRRLYAVKQPDYLENLRRVQNILDEVPASFLVDTVKMFEETVSIMTHLEIMKGLHDEPV